MTETYTCLLCDREPQPTFREKRRFMAHAVFEHGLVVETLLAAVARGAYSIAGQQVEGRMYLLPDGRQLCMVRQKGR